MKTLNTLLVVVLLAGINPAEAKKPPKQAHKQWLPEQNLTRSVLRKKPTALASAATTNESYTVAGTSDPLTIARQYIRHELAKMTHLNADDVRLDLISQRSGLAFDTLRFRQMHQGLPVIGGYFTVNINRQGVVRQASHQLYAVQDLPTPKSLLSEQHIMSTVGAYFNHPAKNPNHANRQAAIWPGEQTQLVWQVDYAFEEGAAQWQLLVDANSGEVIRAVDRMLYETVPVQVFDPDPLTSSGMAYGGGLVDGGDANTPELTAQLFNRTLEVTAQDGVYLLINDWVESADLSFPFDGDYSQSDDDFSFERSQASFEAVNIAWHITEYMSYINDQLGLDVRPYQYTTGILFDAHGNGDADASSYTSDGTLRFGDGCVDDGEDADVIIHELGHGIHDWLTNGSYSQVDGLSEGLGDYFAQSYSRSRPDGAWNRADPQYHQVFSWDGHNECWPGRITNYERTYPDGLIGQIHTDGQIWSSCLMNIWEQVGRERTDTMVIEGIAMTNITTNQQQAAQAVLMAAEELGYADDLLFIEQTFQACGYQVGISAGPLAVAVESSTEQAGLGDVVTLTANPAGGSGSHSYRWDINGDGHIDGTGRSISLTHSQAMDETVQVLVTDGNNQYGLGQASLSIQAPDVQVATLDDPAQDLQQVCGNDDGVIDPGERWQANLTVTNPGTQSASDAWLALAVNREQNQAADITDAQGNALRVCGREFIDITQTGTFYDWTSAGTGFPAADEGFVSISLLNTFEHYGQTVDTLVASTNGYLNTSPDADGSDWSKDCPLPVAPDLDEAGGRIAAFHSDLKDAQFYHQSFSECPRQPDNPLDSACEVFLWKGADLWETTNQVEQIDVQAILYTTTSQWVFQYAGAGLGDLSPTVGMQNDGASDGLSLACTQAGSVNDQAAVCLYAAAHVPTLITQADQIRLETPVISLADLAINGSTEQAMTFAITEDAQCGTVVAFDHQATVYTEGFNAGQSRFINTAVGDAGVCEAVTTCGVGDSTQRSSSNDIQPVNGLWWNPGRSGNGVDLHVTNQQNMLYVMYTAREDRSPIWYLTSGADSADNQYHNELYEVIHPGGFAAGDRRYIPVGWSNTSFINPKKAVQVREINGRLSADLMVLDQFDADATPNQHTGHYFAPTEDGWGQSVITLGNSRVVISYIYDAAGNPLWTLSSGPNDASTRDVFYGSTFCPHCPVLSLEGELVGEVSMDFNGQNDGVINQYIISYPPQSMQPQATWNARQLPIINVVGPGGQ